EDGNRLRLALHDDAIDFPHLETHAERVPRKLADDQARPVGLARAFEPRGKIHAVADRRIIHALDRSDVARYNFVGIDTDADMDRLMAKRNASRIQFLQLAQHRYTGLYRAVGVTLFLERNAEQRH